MIEVTSDMILDGRALALIERALVPLARVWELIRPHISKGVDPGAVGIWSQTSNKSTGDNFTLTAGDAKRAWQTLRGKQDGSGAEEA